MIPVQGTQQVKHTPSEWWIASEFPPCVGTVTYSEPLSSCRFPTNMPTLVQHDQHMHPMLTSTDTASLVHQEAQSVSAMPANTNSSNSGLPSETKTMQQLALMLGRRGLERAAQSMQQHRAAVQHSSNSAYHSKLSWELLSSISWLPSWCQQHTTSKQPRQQPSAATHSWYAGDMYDDIQQEAMSFAQGQAAAVHGTKPTADSVSTRAPANLYAMQTPQLKTSRWLLSFGLLHLNQ